MGLNESYYLRNFDRYLAIIGVIFSLTLIIYLSRENGRAIYLLTGFLALISCVLWLVIRKSHSFTDQTDEPRKITTVCAIFYFLLYTVSILSVYFRPTFYERPLTYFIVITMMAGIIAIQVFTSGRRHVPLILFQIITLGINIAWSQLLIFPSLLGVDPWTHFELTLRIIDGGIVPDGYGYSKLPLFHIIIAETSLLTDLSYKYAVMATVSLVQLICNASFIYIITHYLFKDYRVGLISALMVIIANQHIFMSYWSIPNGFAVIFIHIIIYLILFRLMKNDQKLCTINVFIVILLLMIAIIFTHTIASLSVAIALFVIWGANILTKLIYEKKSSFFSLSLPLIFTVMMFAWWSYASGHIDTLRELIEWGFNADFFGTSPSAVDAYETSIPLSEQLFNNLGMFLYFALSFIGCFYMVSKKGNSSTFLMAWVGIMPLSIAFFSSIMGYSVIDHRWWYLAQIFLSIPLALAIKIIGTWKAKKSYYIFIFSFIFTIIMAFLMIMSPSANLDNHTLSPNSAYRAAYTESELQSISGVTNIFSGDVGTESSIANEIMLVDSNVKFINIDENIFEGNFSDLKQQNILIRDEIATNTFGLFHGPYRLDYNIYEKLLADNYCITYCTNSIVVYSKI